MTAWLKTPRDVAFLRRLSAFTRLAANDNRLG
jgi:hypothetical protein